MLAKGAAYVAASAAGAARARPCPVLFSRSTSMLGFCTQHAAPATAVSAQCSARLPPSGRQQRFYSSVVQTLAKAAVAQALDKAILKDASRGSSEDATDIDTWKALVDLPVVKHADNVDMSDLYLISNDMTDALDLSRHPGASAADPFALVAEDIRGMNASIRDILGVDHPVLAKVAQYFFSTSSGKKIRPAMVLLMSHAVNHHIAAGPGAAAAGLPRPTAAAVEAAVASIDAAEAAGAAQAESPAAYLPADAVFRQQRRLAEITEMIHTASLLHDDVIDVSDTRRGMQSVNSVFGNKLAILAGDFLLARASVCLARLRNIPVVELLSTVIEHLVKGEVMQMRTAIAAAVSATSAPSVTALSSDEASLAAVCRAAFDMYLRKSYYKTSSLMANSCRAIALLGRYPAPVAEAAFRYGLHVGMAFQLVDDLLDFEGHTAALGKPVLADIQQGLATAPVLFAAQRYPVLLPCIERKFEAPGDVDLVLKFVAAADGLTATRRLAIAHGQMALDALTVLEPGPARTALACLVTKVLSRDS